MEADEVPSVKGQHHTIAGNGGGEDILVWKGLPSATAFRSGQHIMATTTKPLNRRQREVLVSVQTGHRSRCFVSRDKGLHFIPMRSRIGPGVGQVFGTQRWIVEK